MSVGLSSLVWRHLLKTEDGQLIGLALLVQFPPKNLAALENHEGKENGLQNGNSSAFEAKDFIQPIQACMVLYWISQCPGRKLFVLDTLSCWVCKIASKVSFLCQLTLSRCREKLSMSRQQTNAGASQVDKEVLCRKRASYILQQSMRAELAAGTAWHTFFLLYDVLEEFAPYLIQAWYLLQLTSFRVADKMFIDLP